MPKGRVSMELNFSGTNCNVQLRTGDRRFVRVT